MKILNHILFFILLSLNCFSQDSVYFRNGEKIFAKVTEVNQYEIKYFSSSDKHGTAYWVNKHDVAKIKFKNGQIDTFSIKEINPQFILSQQPNKISYLFGKYHYNGKTISRNEIFTLTESLSSNSSINELRILGNQTKNYLSTRKITGLIGLICLPLGAVSVLSIFFNTLSDNIKNVNYSKIASVCFFSTAITLNLISSFYHKKYKKGLAKTIEVFNKY